MSRKFLVPLVLPADPTAALEAATKQYVDSKASKSEVEIAAADPIGANAAAELWYDTTTAAPAILSSQIDYGLWLTYTPVVTAASGGINLGSTPDSQGFYMRFGKLVMWQVYVTAGGAGITNGSGTYNCSLPVPATGSQICGHGWLYGAAGFKTFVADVQGASGTRMIKADGSYINQADGFTNTGHVLAIGGMYRAA